MITTKLRNLILGALIAGLGIALTASARAQSVNPQVTDAVTQVQIQETLELEEQLTSLHPGTISTVNYSPHPVWITIYNDTLGMIREAGCVFPGQYRDWTKYLPAFNYKVRSEMIDAQDCRGRVLHDDSTVIKIGETIPGVVVTVDGNNHLDVKQNQP